MRLITLFTFVRYTWDSCMHISTKFEFPPLLLYSTLFRPLWHSEWTVYSRLHRDFEITYIIIVKYLCIMPQDGLGHIQVLLYRTVLLFGSYISNESAWYLNWPCGTPPKWRLPDFWEYRLIQERLCKISICASPERGGSCPYGSLKVQNQGKSVHRLLHCLVLNVILSDTLIFNTCHEVLACPCWDARINWCEELKVGHILTLGSNLHTGVAPKPYICSMLDTWRRMEPSAHTLGNLCTSS